MPPSFPEVLTRARGVLFDFDNVLVDSEPLHYQAYQEVFDRFGHRLDPEEYWVYWTSRGEGPAGEIARHGLPLDPAMIRREKAPLYADLCRSGVIPWYEEGVEVVRLLHGRGFPLAIASGSTSEDLGALLARRDLTGLFRVILGKDRVSREKPDPEIFLRAAGELGVPPAECIVFEDAEKGVLAANAAGIPVAVIRTRYTAAIPFPGADFIFPGHAEWLAAVREALGG